MITIDSKLTLITGLHIGGADDSMKIGGVDSPVLKREIYCDDNGKVSFNSQRKVTEPYIAGSSLKGKIRSLLEHYFKLIDPTKKGNVVDSSSIFGNEKYRNLIVKLFGEGANTKKDNDTNNKSINITRVIFRDCFITDEVRYIYLENRVKLSEEKFENVIDRVTGTTINGGLRQIERVPSGVEFDFNMSLRIFENDDEELFKNTILLGIKLLELDALGGSGSRGYGRVGFSNFKDDSILKIYNKKIKDLDDCINKLLKKEKCDEINKI